ncbi:hypothetical protein ACOME3_001666 [Neoechinorhynchus agilis]
MNILLDISIHNLGYSSSIVCKSSERDGRNVSFILGFFRTPLTTMHYPHDFNPPMPPPPYVPGTNLPFPPYPPEYDPTAIPYRASQQPPLPYPPPMSEYPGLSSTGDYYGPQYMPPNPPPPPPPQYGGYPIPPPPPPPVPPPLPPAAYYPPPPVTDLDYGHPYVQEGEPKQPSDELFERAALTNTYVTYNVLESDNDRSVFKINLRIDQYMFPGEGTSMLEAINDACSKALQQGDIFRPAKRIKPDPILGAAAAAAAAASGAVRPLILPPIGPSTYSNDEDHLFGSQPNLIQPLKKKADRQTFTNEFGHPDGIGETPFTRILDKIIPSDDSQTDIESLLSAVELVLRNYGKDAVTGDDVEENEVGQSFKNIVRFGLYDKEIMLRGEYEAELAIVCFGRQVRAQLVDRVCEFLKNQLNLSKEEQEYEIDRPDRTWMISVRRNQHILFLYFTCEGIWHVLDDEEDEADYLSQLRIPHFECRRVSAYVRHNEWFKQALFRRNNQLCALLLIRHICENNYRTWGAVPLYYYEIIVSMCTVHKFQNPPLLWIMKKVMEIVSSGIFMYVCQDEDSSGRKGKRCFEFNDPSKMPIVVTREVWPLPSFEAAFRVTCDANTWLRYIASDDVWAIFDFEDYFDILEDEEIEDFDDLKQLLTDLGDWVSVGEETVSYLVDEVERDLERIVIFRPLTIEQLNNAAFSEDECKGFDCLK